MKGESVYLHTEALADHAVEWVPVYPDLLAHGHTGAAHEGDERRLNSGVGQ